MIIFVGNLEKAVSCKRPNCGGLEAGATLLVRPFLSLESEVVVRSCIVLTAFFGVKDLEKSVKRCCCLVLKPILVTPPALVLVRIVQVHVKLICKSFAKIYFLKYC